MSEVSPKPLHWTPDPNVGYQVFRRPDGGMHITFTDVTHATLLHWREFALSHLLDSDRLTRNLYDLRQIEFVPEEAIQFAIEANSDPSARHIRVAVVVSNQQVKEALEKIRALSSPGGVELGVFNDIEQAEQWLNRPIDLLI